jgi:predicted metal-dependent HD superfamily phosphohydrolase
MAVVTELIGADETPDAGTPAATRDSPITAGGDPEGPGPDDRRTTSGGAGTAGGDPRRPGLGERWRTACRGAGATASDAGIDDAGRDLLRRWAEEHRRYHDTTHLLAVLDVVDDCAGPDRVRLAAWFHDAVYDPRAAGDANEQASAALAADVLAGLGVPAAVTADVARLVLVTAGHAPTPGDADSELLCDADLAVLAQTPQRYAEYAARIRQEYAHVPDEVFRAGRAHVLCTLLALPSLFHHPALPPGWQSQARTNLLAELAALDPPG